MQRRRDINRATMMLVLSLAILITSIIVALAGYPNISVGMTIFGLILSLLSYRIVRRYLGR